MSPLLYSKVKLTSTNKALRSGMDLLQPDDSFEHRVGVLLIVWLVPSLRGLVCHLGEPQFGGQRENRSIKWYLYLWNGRWIWKRSFTRSFIKESSLKTKWEFFWEKRGFLEFGCQITDSKELNGSHGKVWKGLLFCYRSLTPIQKDYLRHVLLNYLLGFHNR